MNRDVERDRTKLEREEKKIEAEIKKAAKAGNKVHKSDQCHVFSLATELLSSHSGEVNLILPIQAACTVLAKQLVQLRKQKQRTYVASSQITAAGYTAKAMGANVRMAEAMGETTKTMGQV